MGCDIHMLVELKDWHSNDDNETWHTVIEEPAAFGLRSYTTFALLAGVRNYHDLKPIAEPRGLPADVSLEAKKASEDYGSDGHSHSWLTLAEVLAFDWSQHPQAGAFADWAKGLTSGPTDLHYRKPERIRLVFWFDN